MSVMYQMSADTFLLKQIRTLVVDIIADTITTPTMININIRLSATEHWQRSRTHITLIMLFEYFSCSDFFTITLWYRKLRLFA